MDEVKGEQQYAAQAEAYATPSAAPYSPSSAAQPVPAPPGASSTRSQTQVVLTMPSWTRKLGYNFSVRSLGEYHEVLNFVLYARVALAVLLLISWACAASAVSQLQPFGIGLSPLNWGLAFGIISWLYVVAHGICAFLSLGSNRSEGLLKFVATGIYADLAFVFLSMSAFTSLADVSAGSGWGTPGAAAAFMFFSWLVWLYVLPLSWIVSKDRRVVREAAQGQSQPSPPTAAAPGSAVAQI
jgi:hypothetical protein